MEEMNRHMTAWRGAALLTVLLTAGCSGGVAERSLDSGEPVASLAARADTAVVLVYAPSDCLTCYGSLQPWLEWGRAHPDAFSLVFTRPPTRSERMQLAAYRIRPHGLLEPRALDRVLPVKTPAEALFIDGRMVSARVLEKRELTTPLLRQLTASTPPAAPRPDPAAKTEKP
jgi:hypothetical protein